MTTPIAHDDPRHGTHGGYTAGCRCERCREANAAYSRAYRPTMTPEQKARRRGQLRARYRAQRELARRHPGEYFDLYLSALDEVTS